MKARLDVLKSLISIKISRYSQEPKVSLIGAPYTNGAHLVTFEFDFFTIVVDPEIP